MGRIYRKGRKYKVDIRINGKRLRKTVGENKEVAQRVLVELESRAIKQEHDILDNKISIQELLTAYYKHIESNFKKSSVKRTKHAFSLLLPKLSVERVEQITKSLIISYRNERMKQVSTRTVNLEIGTLKAMLNYGVHAGLLGSNHLRELPALKAKATRSRRALTSSEIEKFLQASSEHYYPIWLTFLATGIRKAELTHLEWTDIDFENSQIHIQCKEDWTTKTGNNRVIPMGGKLKKILAELKMRKSSDFVFTTQQGAKLKRGLLERFHETIKRAEINPQGLDIHALRVTFITHLISNGTDPKTVQELAGHKNITTTLSIYTKVLPGSKVKAINTLSFLASKDEKTGEEKVKNQLEAI